LISEYENYNAKSASVIATNLDGIISAPILRRQFGEGKSLKVFTDIPYVYSHLRLPSSEAILVENEDEADILWLADDFFEGMEKDQNGKYFNQFFGEKCLTFKNLLVELIRCHKTY